VDLKIVFYDVIVVIYGKYFDRKSIIFFIHKSIGHSQLLSSGMMPSWS